MSGSQITVTAPPGRPLDVQFDGTAVPLRPKERAVVAALALRHPDVVTVDQLIGLVWTDGPPASAQQSIHNHLARLRRVADGLIATERTGYRFGADVAIEIASDTPLSGTGHRTDPSGDDEYLVELGAAPHLTHARAAFVARHHRATDFDPIEELRAQHPGDVRSAMEHAVAADPLDERSWSLLAVATVATHGRTEAVGVIDRARSALIDVGLEPGRRLLDLHRLISDGVESVDVLLAHTDGSPTRAASGSSKMRDALREIRSIWSQQGTFRVDVAGADSVARRAFLARLIDDARASGFATATARCMPDDIGPPTIRLAHAGRRPLIAVLDGTEHCDASFDDLAAVVAAVHRAHGVGSPPVGWILTGSISELPEMLEHVDTTMAVDVSELAVDVSELAIDVGPAIRHHDDNLSMMLAALRLLGEPTLIDVLDEIVPGAAAAALDAARAGSVRVDPANRLIDLSGPDVGAAELDDLGEDVRRALTTQLLDVDFPAADSARRETRRAAFALVAAGADATMTIDTTLRAAAPSTASAVTT